MTDNFAGAASATHVLDLSVVVRSTTIGLFLGAEWMFDGMISDRTLMS
jgi:hypothetical protein